MSVDPNYDDVPFASEKSADPEFKNLLVTGSISNISESGDVKFTSATFYRTDSNVNIELSFGLGVDISPGLIYLSPTVYLPPTAWNNTKPITDITYSGADMLIAHNATIHHDIVIFYSLEKPDNTNFKNNRELRVTLVKSSGMEYDASVFTYGRPDPSAHDHVLLRGALNHTAGDTVKIKFSIVQDNLGTDQTATKMTIFQISWTGIVTFV